MPKKIEIFENTLLKLLIRRGTDADRKQVVLSEGELGYTIDTKRLYVGDGQTAGGILVGGDASGSGFLGSVPNVTTFTSAVVGSLAYDNDNNVLYTFRGGSPSNIANWEAIGGNYTSGNGTISISNTNNIVVDKLSAGNFSSNALGTGLRLDGSNKIALSSTIAIRKISIEQGSTSLDIPSSITTNGVNFTLPSTIGGPGKFLTSQNDGTLNWDTVSNPTITVNSPLTAVLNGLDVTDVSVALSGDLQIGFSDALTQLSNELEGQIQENTVPPGAIMAFAMNSAPPGWLACDGALVDRSGSSGYSSLFNAIGTTYNVGGEAATKFRLPDLRGYFVRGFGTNSDTTASGTFGTKQADQLKSHTHSLGVIAGTDGDDGTDSVLKARNGSGTTGATGGDETRPRNIAMLYCIKH